MSDTPDKLQSLEQTLPNGFHDARCRRIVIDRAAASLTLTLEVDMSTSEGGGRPKYRLCELNINGLRRCQYDEAFPMGVHPSGFDSTVDSGVIDDEELQQFNASLPQRPGIARWFFFNGSFSRMMLLAEEASLRWL